MMIGILTAVLMATGSAMEAETVAAETEKVAVEASDTTIHFEETMKGVRVISPKERGFVREQASSVSTVTAEMMEAKHVNSIKGVSSMVPNFFMPDYGSRLTSAIYIRGIGSRINNPAVALYVDGVPYVDKSSYDFALNDVERVDVLRGPQGTLYGRNTMGGIVNVKTVDPFHAAHRFVARAGYASGDDHRNASLAYNHAVSDMLALAVSGHYEGSSGFFKNDVTGRKADGMESGGGRARLMWNGFRWKHDATVGYEYSDEYAYPYYYTGQVEGAEPYADCIGKITANHDGRYRRSMLNASWKVDYERKGWEATAVTGYQFLNDRMLMDQDFIAKDIYTLEQRQRSNTLNEEITFKGKHGKWEWVTGAFGMYQWLHTEAPVTFYSDGVQWLEGLINGYMPDVKSIASLNKMGFSSMGVGFEHDKALSLGGTFDTPTLNTALFHQSTFRLTDRLSATLGLRLDYEHNSIDFNANPTVDYSFVMENSAAAMMSVRLDALRSNFHMLGNLKRDYVNVLPKMSLKYELQNDGNVYFSLGKGMRSGGYNIQMISDLLQNALRIDMMEGIKTGVNGYLQSLVDKGMPEYVIGSVTNTMEQNMPKFDAPEIESIAYKPEQSWSYELGTHLNFYGVGGGMLQTDASLFYMHTRDQQIARFTDSGMGRIMVNAGKSRSCGAELSLTYTPDYNFYLRGNYGFTHATFTEWNMGDQDGMSTDYTGNYVPFVPQHTVNLDASYKWRFKGAWLESMTLGADYMGAGKIYWVESNEACQKFYSLLGARLSLAMKNLTITLWGKNLTDTKYNTFYFESVGRGYEQHGKPMQVGVDVRVNL